MAACAWRSRSSRADAGGRLGVPRGTLSASDFLSAAASGFRIASEAARAADFDGFGLRQDRRRAALTARSERFGMTLCDERGEPRRLGRGFVARAADAYRPHPALDQGWRSSSRIGQTSRLDSPISREVLLRATSQTRHHAAGRRRDCSRCCAAVVRSSRVGGERVAHAGHESALSGKVEALRLAADGRSVEGQGPGSGTDALPRRGLGRRTRTREPLRMSLRRRPGAASTPSPFSRRCDFPAPGGHPRRRVAEAGAPRGPVRRAARDAS